jgi:hypothetical protein
MTYDDRDVRRDVTVESDVAGTTYLADAIRWGPIWGGLLTAVGIFLLLSLLATAIGLSTIELGASAGAISKGAGVVSAILALISFIIGGYVAGRTAGIVSEWNGALNGFLVWALATILFLLLAAIGAGQIFGATNAVFSEFQRSIGQNINPSQLQSTVQTSAWLTFLGLALAAVGSAIGGWLGVSMRTAGREPVTRHREVHQH